MAFYKDERLALFIDGANLYSSARALGLEIDFRKLLKEFQGRGRLIRASYYTALVESDEYSPIRPLVDWLAYNGFTVVKKAAREYTDREGRKRHRGNMDVELTVDTVDGKQSIYGVGIDTSITMAPIRAMISALNKLPV